MFEMHPGSLEQGVARRQEVIRASMSPQRASRAPTAACRRDRALPPRRRDDDRLARLTRAGSLRVGRATVRAVAGSPRRRYRARSVRAASAVAPPEGPWRRESLDGGPLPGSKVRRDRRGRPGALRGRVEVVDIAEPVLERDDAADEFGRLRFHRLADEFERVAQPLGGDPQVVERRDIRVRQGRVERPRRLVRLPGHGGRPRPDRRRGVRLDGPRAGARSRQQSLVIVHEAGEPRRPKSLDEFPVASRTLRGPGVEQRRQARPARASTGARESRRGSPIWTSRSRTVAELSRRGSSAAGRDRGRPGARTRRRRPASRHGRGGWRPASRGPPPGPRRRWCPGRARAFATCGSAGSSVRPRPTGRRRRPPGCARRRGARPPPGPPARPLRRRSPFGSRPGPTARSGRATDGRLVRGRHDVRSFGEGERS